MIKLTLAALLVAGLTFTGCSTDATTASRNLSVKADMFELERRIVFYNGITAQYILSIEGRCSVTDSGHKLAVTCKTGNNEFKKHQLGLSDNVTYFSEQLSDARVSVYHNRIIFKPQSIINNVDFRGANTLSELTPDSKD